MSLGRILRWVRRSMPTGEIAWRVMKRSVHEILASGMPLLSRTRARNVHPSMPTLVIRKSVPVESVPVESVFGIVVKHIPSTSACSDLSIVLP